MGPPSSQSERDTSRPTILRQVQGKLKPDLKLCQPGTTFLVVRDTNKDLFRVPHNIRSKPPTWEEAKEIRRGKLTGRFSNASISLAAAFGSLDAHGAVGILDENDINQELGALRYQPMPLDSLTPQLPRHDRYQLYFVHMRPEELPTFYFRLGVTEERPRNVQAFRGIVTSTEVSSPASSQSDVYDDSASDSALVRSLQPSPEEDRSLHIDTSQAQSEPQWIPFDVRHFEDTNAPLMFLDTYTRKSGGWPMIRCKYQLIPDILRIVMLTLSYSEGNDSREIHHTSAIQKSMS